MISLAIATPFILRLSKDCLAPAAMRRAARRKGRSFDKLRTGGIGLGLLFLAALPAQAQQTADLDAVDRAVAQFTGVPQGQSGGAALPVDRRLRLAPCRAPLALSWHNGGRASVEVQCPMPGGWKLYVPIVGGGPAAAAPANAITRGDAVTVTVQGDGFAVSQGGEALEGGPIGAWIKVRTLTPGAPVLRAQVLRSGAVGIPLP